ncbi:MAG: hypothetical protein ACREDR_41075, partial [Blastocatellia bacterium]
VFTREPEVKTVSKRFMRKCVGEYELAGRTLLVNYSVDDFAITAPGQPDYQLVPDEDAFNLKNTPGYSVQFLVDDSEVVIGVTVKQPNGVFRLNKVK